MPTEGKSRIIEATRRVISRSGIAAATMRAIANEADLSTGAIYHYYKNKEEILYDVMDESLSVSSRIAEETKQGGHSREEIIEEIYLNIISRLSKTDENRLQLYLSKEAVQGNSELKEKFQDKYKEWIGKTEELMQYLYGEQPTRRSKALATLLIGAIDGVAMQLLLGANQAEVEEIAEVYHELLKEGIPKFLVQLSASPLKP